MKRKGKFKKYLKILGPGLITGASDDDPSGIATYSQAGAQFGYGLWLTLAQLAYVATVFVVEVPSADVLSKTLVPHVSWNQEYITTVVAG